MTLQQRLAWRYGLVVFAALVLLAGLIYHEFATEQRLRAALPPERQAEAEWGESVEVVMYAMIPVILAGGWWLTRRSLTPLSDLAQAVERIQLDNLREQLPRSGDGDEVDRLTEAFNVMTARLDQSFQQIRDFTLHASHELKTPLTVMRGELESALQEAGTCTPQQQERLHSLLDETERLTKIVDALTLLSKVDAGQVVLERAPVRMAELVREAYEDALILAEPAGIQVTLTECADAIVLGDRHRLRQLLLNLMDNAIKYNRTGGTVAIGLRNTGGFAEVEIVNTGAGIPPALLGRVFDRFVRGDEARSNAVEGSGLGLSIAQWITRSQGGMIQLTSEPGKTTTAIVRLPLAVS
jgi:signal transduction histidine kinase